MSRGFWIKAFLIVAAVGLVGVAGMVAGTYVRTVGGGKIAGRNVPYMRPAFGGKQEFTVLVLGLDVKDKLNPKLGQRADSIIMLKVDLEQKRVKGLSVPRDSLVEIPGEDYKDKINATYQVGGIEKTIQALEKLLYVRPDYYVVSEPAGFEKLVDLIGGIDLDVEKDMDYDDNWQDLHIHLKKGFQHLNGEQAMGYVRFRKDRFSDITRMERQQKFLRAVARRMVSISNLPKLPKIMEQMKQAVRTDIESADMIYLATTLRNATGENIQMATVPSTPEMRHGISYLILDEKRTKELAANTFDLDLPGIGSVEVLNGSEQKGAAKKVARKLEELGYRVVRVDNAGEQKYTVSRVLYRQEKASSANQIASLLGTADMLLKTDTPPPGDTNAVANAPASSNAPAPSPAQEDEKSDLTVIVGDDFTDAMIQ